MVGFSECPLLYDTTGGSDGYRYKIGKFNSAGVQIDQIELSDDYPITQVAGPIKYLNPITKKEMWALPFTSIFTSDGNTYQTRVGICLIDETGEKKSQIIASANDPERTMTGAFLQKKFEVDDDQVNPENFNDVFGFTYTRSVQTNSRRVLQNVDITTLEKLGNEIIISGNFRVNFDASSQLTFSNGNRVRISQQEGAILQVDTPILRDLTPAEIISNRNLQPGKQNTDPTIKEQILAFQPATKTDLGTL